MTITISGNRLNSEIARQSGLARQIATTQEQISTGKRLRTPSDDPGASARIAVIARSQSDGEVWKQNLSAGAALAAQADSVLASLSDRMIAARTAMLSGASGTATAADRATHAGELRGLARDVADLRATQTPSGDPLFAPTAALSLRVDADTLLAPIDSAANVFDRDGTALTTDLDDAAKALESGDAARIDAALARLNTAIDHVSSAAGDQGLRAARIDRLSDARSAQGIDLAAERSALEDTDLTSAIAQLNAQQLTLDAAQAAFARINRRTLFDILG